ncbi:MAG TPA: hypothetical protein VGF38_19975 [Ktedonobacterales bacterium]
MPGAAEDLHAHIPGSRLVVMPGIGHLSNPDTLWVWFPLPFGGGS